MNIRRIEEYLTLYVKLMVIGEMTLMPLSIMALLLMPDVFLLLQGMLLVSLGVLEGAAIYQVRKEKSRR